MPKQKDAFKVKPAGIERSATSAAVPNVTRPLDYIPTARSNTGNSRVFWR